MGPAPSVRYRVAAATLAVQTATVTDFSTIKTVTKTITSTVTVDVAPTTSTQSAAEIEKRDPRNVHRPGHHPLLHLSPIITTSATAAPATTTSSADTSAATESSSEISAPTYASECYGTLRYVSACECWGITAAQKTVTAVIAGTGAATNNATTASSSDVHGHCWSYACVGD